jgi:hypothetical protein
MSSSIRTPATKRNGAIYLVFIGNVRHKMTLTGE